MMFRLIFLGLIATVSCQFSFYASRVGHVGLLPQFRTTTDSSLSNREGLDGETSTRTTTTALPPELKIKQQNELLEQRISQWPEHRQPFWYKNRKVIQSQREKEVHSDVDAVTKLPVRSPFLGERGRF